MLVNSRRALHLAAALLTGAVLLGALLALPATEPGLQRVDDAVLRWVDVGVPGAVGLAEALSLIGGVWVTWPIRIAAAGVLALQRRWLQLTAFVLAVVSSEVLIGVLKSAYARPRPPGGLIETSGLSFPSGHAIAGAVTAVGIVVCLLPPGRRRYAWELRAVGFAFLMALSRVYLRAHWLSDAVAGALLGGGLAIGWPAVLQTVVRRREPTRSPPPAAPARRD